MAETTYEVRYDDTDPVITYSPYGDGSSAGGWETVFAGGTRPAVGGSTYGVGDSTHVTQLPGATLSFRFWGTSITLLGDAGGASFFITVDNDELQTPTPTGSTIASLNGLAEGDHVFVLQVTSVKSRFTFDQAIFNVGTGTTGTSISNVTYRTLDGAWEYDTGAWHPAGPLTPLPRDGMVVLRTSNQDAPAVVNVSGNAVFLYGNAFPGSGIYEVHLGAQSWQFNASSHNFIQDALIFCHTEMDPTQSYLLWVINKDAGLSVDLDYVHVLRFDGGSESSSISPLASNLGTKTSETASESRSTGIASLDPTVGPSSTAGGGVSGGHRTHMSPGFVGGVAAGGGGALLVLIALVVLAIRWRRGRRLLSGTDNDTPSESDSTAPTVEPWIEFPGSTPLSPNDEHDLRLRKAEKFLPLVPQAHPRTAAEINDRTSFGSSTAVDIEPVGQLAATRIDNRSRTTTSEAETAPPPYS